MSQDTDSGLTPASDVGSEFTGDLGLPTAEDTSDLDPVSPEEAEPAAEADSSDGEVDGNEGVQEPAQVDEQAAAEAAAKFALLGKEWDNQQAFEQHYKSLEGRVRAQGQEVAKLNNIIDQWERWHQYQETTQKATAKPEADEGEAKKAKEPFLEAIDWNAVKRLNQEKGFDVAAQAIVIGLQDHIQNEVLKGLESKIEEATKPLRDQEEASQADNYVKGWFQKAANEVDPETGDPIFPDLYEGDGGSFERETATEIVNAWANLVRQFPDFGMSKEGIEYAITQGKSELARKGTQKTKASEGAKAVVRDAHGRFVKQSETATSAEEGKGVDTADVTEQSGKPLSEEEETRRAIRNAGKQDKRASFFGMA